MSRKITIFGMDVVSQEQLKAVLARENMADYVVFEEGVRANEDENCGSLWVGPREDFSYNMLKIKDKNCFFTPVRAGAIIELIGSYMRANNRESLEKVTIGPFTLDTQNNELLQSDDRSVRLTDKEKEILVFLKNAGKTVDRDILLEKIWAYVPDIDTHTLETHIYRLRQKIERDPGRPEILLTDGSGYRLRG